MITTALDIAIDEIDLTRDITKQSFYDFVREFWEDVVAEEAIWNWHIKYLCDELQYVAERVLANKPKEYDLIINQPPGTTKSTVTSICLPAWMWARKASTRVIGGSYTHAIALELSRKNRDLIQTKKYRQLFPEIMLKDDQNTKGHFANTKKGSRYAVGIGGSVTGMHAHLIIIDDPLDPNMSVSEADLKAANHWMDETLPSRKVDKRVTPTILIMQRLHQDDPTGHRLDKKKAGPVKHICLDAEGENVKPESAKLLYDQTMLLDPIRLPRDVLDEASAELGEVGYSCQYRQEPIPRGGYMFKVSRIRIDTPPPMRMSVLRDGVWSPGFKQLVRFWDNAATHDGGCFTVGIKMGTDHEDRIWVLHVVRGQWDSGEREQQKVQTAKIDGKLVIIGIEEEGGSGGKDQALGTTKRLMGYRVRCIRPTGDKVVRADEFSSQVNSHNVMMAIGEWNHDYIEELRYFPSGKYKDQVDASSGCFSILAKPKKRAGVVR